MLEFVLRVTRVRLAVIDVGIAELALPSLFADEVVFVQKSVPFILGSFQGCDSFRQFVDQYR